MEVKGARVIVTGGAGFIGSHLVDRLLEKDNEVVVVDDFSTGSMDKLAGHGRDKRLAVINADILNEGRMYEVFAGADFVFHLACRNVRLSLRRPTIVHEVNATGTLNVLKASAKAGIRRFLYCSSSEVSGTAGVVPMPEEYDFRPETIYGASKLAGEYYTQVFHRSGYLEAVIARPHNNYGPRSHYEGDKGEAIPRFIIRALCGLEPIIYGNGQQTRDFTYVTETAEFLCALLEADGASGGTFNLCRGEEVSILEIARIITELTGLDKKPLHLTGRPSDVLRLYGDPSRLFRLLGRKPLISVREGLQKTVAWFRENVPLTNKTLSAMLPENWEAVSPEQWMNATS